MDRFKKLGKIGQGAHGTVIKCERKKVNELENSKKEIVAIKKMKFSYLSNEQGLASQVIRELMYVQELRHENIVRLYEVFPHHKSLNLVFEYVPFNLEEIIHRERFSFSDANVKSFCKMLLSAIAHCHSKWVLHRDIKPSNCLVSCSGVLKVADFGLAKQFGNLEQALSPEACTLWYRAPELLFGSRLYGEAMDLWAVGCVFGEMLSRKVLFPGDRTVISQLSAIFAIRGSPDEGKWPVTCFEFKGRDNVAELF
ncbi:hypothetical protein MHBO_001136 [Bonamia ostreae]|uniref:Cyclin-dependent kinase 2 homolog n=1 Tax=Bonamia ostreae TaxID=126728 RepID=A0ABV2AHV8_9EUKA